MSSTYSFILLETTLTSYVLCTYYGTTSTIMVLTEFTLLTHTWWVYANVSSKTYVHTFDTAFTYVVGFWFFWPRYMHTTRHLVINFILFDLLVQIEIVGLVVIFVEFLRRYEPNLQYYNLLPPPVQHILILFSYYYRSTPQAGFTYRPTSSFHCCSRHPCSQCQPESDLCGHTSGCEWSIVGPEHYT